MNNIYTASSICNRLQDVGGHPYYVGGFVRSLLSDEGQSKDIDIVVTGLNQAKLVEAFPNGKMVGKSFPVMLVDGIEVALARIERKIGEGHAGFSCETEGVTIEQDLYRRDLTINAMAIDAIKNPGAETDYGHEGLQIRGLLDPYNGRKDLHNGILCPVSPAFAEDPLRVFRAARFSAKLSGFQPSEALIELCRSLAPELKTLSAERVFGETVLALKADNSVNYFLNLRRFGALKYWFEELNALYGVPAGPEKHHPELDAFVHTMLCLKASRGMDPVTKWAIVCHDLGKALTDKSLWPKQHDHEELGEVPLKELNDRLKVHNDYRRISELVCKHHLRIHRIEELTAGKVHDLIEEIGDDWPLVVDACYADHAGRLFELGILDYLPKRRYLQYRQEIVSVRYSSDMGTGKLAGERLRNKRISAIKCCRREIKEGNLP